MKIFKIISVFGFLLITGKSVAQTSDNSCKPITPNQIKTMLIQLGHEVKDIGASSYSVTITRDGNTLPVIVELSPNKENLWLTINVGDADSLNVKKNFKYLKENSFSSCFFYVSKNNKLILGQKTDNRGIDNVILRKQLDNITEEASASTYLWGTKNE